MGEEYNDNDDYKKKSIYNYLTEVAKNPKTKCIERDIFDFKKDEKKAIKFFTEKMTKKANTLVEGVPNYKPKVYPEYGEEFQVKKEEIPNSTKLEYLKYNETTRTTEQRGAHIYAIIRNPTKSSSQRQTKTTGGKALRRRL